MAIYTPKNFRLFIEKAEGDFVEIGKVISAKPRTIICEPIPGPNGTIEYVQDWVHLTHFG